MKFKLVKLTLGFDFHLKGVWGFSWRLVKKSCEKSFFIVSLSSPTDSTALSSWNSWTLSIKKGHKVF